jgi:hypothetical protein
MNNAPPGWMPDTEEKRNALIEQVERILTDPLFKHSKRYPSILRYIVRETLVGHADHLKERTLGMDIFGRDPDYDTNEDHVVRTTVGEVRRRLEQYYHKPGHENEVRIDLPLGSYVAEFRAPEGTPAAAAMVPSHPKRFPYLVAAVGAGAIVLALAIWSGFWRQKTALDRFWDPVLNESGSALICIGQNGPSNDAERNLPDLLESQEREASKRVLPRGEENVTIDEFTKSPSWRLHLADVLTTLKIAGYLQAKKKSYRCQSAALTTFADLRNGPSIFIGGFNNPWSMRLMNQMRFSFESSGNIYYIKDRQKLSRRDWFEDTSTPYSSFPEDYAIISRTVDTATNRTVVIASGLTLFGTLAAGEFLADSAYMENIVGHAPKDWNRKKIQIVIATKVINGVSGPPRIIATHFW